MEFLVILLLILLNGVFSMSEIAVISSRKSRLKTEMQAGKRGAASALALASSPGPFLSTVQIGITLIGLLTGIYSGETITNQLEEVFVQVSWLRPVADGLSVTIVLIATTFFNVILGELVPKRIGLVHAERIASLVAPLMKAMSKLAHPLVWMFTRTSDVLISLFGADADKYKGVTEDEIRIALDEATLGGHIEEVEHDIVERVFMLGDRRVSSLMTPRSELVFLNVHASVSEIKRTVLSDVHRVYPVYDQDIGNVVGIARLTDVVGAFADVRFSIHDHLQPANFLLETTSAYRALERFKEKRLNYALVINEYGVLLGMVTMDDVLQALVGDPAEFDADRPDMHEVEEGVWMVDGAYPLSDMLIELDIPPDPSLGRILTVAGLLLDAMQRLPEVGDKIRWKGYGFRIVAMDRFRIQRVEIARINDEPPD